MKTLQDATDQELREEIAKRTEAAKAARLRAHAEHVNSVLRNVEALLAMVPEHSRGTCSDHDPYNSRRGCVRCALIELRDQNEFAFTLRLSLEPFDPERG